MRILTTALSLLLATFSYGQNSTYYISTAGDDNNSGTINSPFRTIEKGIQTVTGGDLIYLRGGTYYPTKTIEIDGATGSENLKTRLFAYPGEAAIIDGSNFTTLSPNINNDVLIRHKAGHWHFKGFKITKSPSSGMLVLGDNANGNIVENLEVYNNGDTGIGVYAGASNTLVINCDSYRNFDPHDNGQDADGFGAKFDVGPGNKFVGCRAWANSDDGWDLWNASNSVTLENCWAYKNGFDIWDFGSLFEGNGDGFKFGQGAGAHIVKNCMAWGNDLRGFNSNNNVSDLQIYNCTSFNNRFLNYGFIFGTGNFVLRNNLSHQGNDQIDTSKDAQFNSWNGDLGVSVTDEDFLSLSSAIAEGARGVNNNLPVSDFLRLAEGSDLIDKGIALSGIDFSGTSPDLGAFESAYEEIVFGIGRVEAEQMELQNYVTTRWSGEASDSVIIETSEQNITGVASYTFDGPSAVYDILIRYRDEDDGESVFRLLVDGQLEKEWIADSITDSGAEWISLKMEDVNISNQSKIEIEGRANLGEYARLDYIEVIYDPSVSYGVGRLEAEHMELINYNVSLWSAEASDSAIIRIPEAGEQGIAKYTFTGPTDQYDIIVRYRDEIDGESIFKLIIDGNDISEWTADQVTSAPDTWLSKAIDNVIINTGAKIEIHGTAVMGEYARLDYIETVKHIPAGEPITVIARGATGEERMALIVDDEIRKIWNVGKKFRAFTYARDFGGETKIAFVNDKYQAPPNELNRNLIVDKIEVRGIVYEAEDMEENTGVWVNNSCGGSYSQRLDCNGYINFGYIDSQGTILSNRQLKSSLFQLYPNPVLSGTISLQLEGKSERARVFITTLEGRLMQENMTNGNGPTTLNISSLSEGAYLLTLQYYNGRRATRMFLKK